MNQSRKCWLQVVVLCIIFSIIKMIKCFTYVSEDKIKDIFHKGFRIASLRFYEAIDANFDQVIYLSSANRRVWTNKKI